MGELRQEIFNRNQFENKVKSKTYLKHEAPLDLNSTHWNSTLTTRTVRRRTIQSSKWSKGKTFLVDTWRCTEISFYHFGKTFRSKSVNRNAFNGVQNLKRIYAMANLFKIFNNWFGLFLPIALLKLIIYFYSTAEENFIGA